MGWAPTTILPDVLQVLDAVQDELTRATIDENWKNRVGRQAELRAKFNAPDLTLRYMGHFQIINLDDQEITIGSMATDEQIGAEIERVRGYQNPPPIPTEKPKMSITGLQSGAFQAKLAEMKQKIADAQNQGLAKVDAAQVQAAAKVNSAIDGVVAKVDKEVEDALQEFAQFTNGGPE